MIHYHHHDHQFFSISITTIVKTYHDHSQYILCTEVVYDGDDDDCDDDGDDGDAV